MSRWSDYQETEQQEEYSRRRVLADIVAEIVVPGIILIVAYGALVVGPYCNYSEKPRQIEQTHSSIESKFRRIEITQSPVRNMKILDSLCESKSR